jgi:hypothetical protein
MNFLTATSSAASKEVKLEVILTSSSTSEAS